MKIALQQKWGSHERSLNHCIKKSITLLALTVPSKQTIMNVTEKGQRNLYKAGFTHIKKNNNGH